MYGRFVYLDTYKYVMCMYLYTYTYVYMDVLNIYVSLYV